MTGRRAPWHPEVLDPGAEETLRHLSESTLANRFYLAGGTGFALRNGHRFSAELDFFSASEFNSANILADLLHSFDSVHLTSRDAGTLHTSIGRTKVSFMSYRYPILFPATAFEGIAVADARDIGCMKLSAVSAKGSRRDFIDLYYICQFHNLQEIMQLFRKKYHGIQYNFLHLLKSLNYFDDADAEPFPIMLHELTWESVKEFFVAQVREFLKAESLL